MRVTLLADRLQKCLATAPKRVMARQMQRSLVRLFLFLTVLGSIELSAQVSFREQAHVAAMRGDNVQAVELYEKALTSAETVFKEEDIELTIRRMELGEAYRAVGRWQDAIKLLENTWNWARNSAGTHNRWNGHEGDLAMNCVEKLARSYQGNSMYEDAIIVLRKGVEDNEQAQRSVEERVQLLALLTDTLLLLNRDKDAGAAANQAMGLVDKDTQTNPVRTARAGAVFGGIYFNHDRIDQARVLLQAAVRLSAQHLPPADETRIRIQQQLGEIFIRDNRLDEAGFLLEDTSKNLLRSQTPDSKLMIEVNISLADLALRRNKPQDALKAAIEARRVCEIHLLPEHPQLGKSLLRMGLAYAKLGQKREAAKSLLEAHKVLVQSLGTSHPETVVAQQALRELQL